MTTATAAQIATAPADSAELTELQRQTKALWRRALQEMRSVAVEVLVGLVFAPGAGGEYVDAEEADAGVLEGGCEAADDAGQNAADDDLDDGIEVASEREKPRRSRRGRRGGRKHGRRQDDDSMMDEQ
jgi:hypothetical protein